MSRWEQRLWIVLLILTLCGGARELRRIAYQLTVANCLETAEWGVLCSAARRGEVRNPVATPPQQQPGDQLP